MAENFFDLSKDDQREALEHVRGETGRPTHLLEKDIWVVWTLSALYGSDLAADLTFKGGTSLSKAYRIIDRFSEDIDLTYDIRKIIPDVIGENAPMPASRSQKDKWSKAVQQRLPEWIIAVVRPLLESALARDRLEVELEIGGDNNDKLLLHYSALARGTGYVSPTVTLEFGARGTGEPHQNMPVVCDMDGHLEGIVFPTASPLVMSVARTFWEKATAAHVYCDQRRIRGERYARHWHDLAAIARSRYFDSVLADRDVAVVVADHKSRFFVEKDADGAVIDYYRAVSGFLKIAPEGEARAALATDYEAMLADAVMVENALPFDELMQACEVLEARVNRIAAASTRVVSEI